jgi:hypothetical protein
MPKINLPGDVSAAQSVQQGLIQNVGALGNLAAGNAAGLGDAFSISLQQAEGLKSQSERADLMASESEFNTRLDNMMPGLTNDISKITLNTVNTVAGLAEQNYQNHLQSVEKAFVLDTFTAAQTDYMDVIKQGALSPKDTNTWFNERMSAAIQAAPSVASQLDIRSKLTQFKIGALEDSYKQDFKNKQQQIGVSLDNTVTNLAKQAYANPSSLSDLLEQSNNIKSVLKSSGYSDEEISANLDVARAKISAASVQKFLDTGDTNSALAMIADAGDIRFDHKAQLLNEALKTYQQSAAQQVDVIRDVSRQSAFLDGSLSRGTKEWESAATSSFMNYYNTELANITVDQNNYLEVAAKTIAYFENFGQGMSKETAKFFTDKLTYSNNPYEIASLSKAIINLTTNPITKSTGAAKDILENKEKFAEAYKINSLVSAGTSPDQAVAKIRESAQAMTPTKAKLLEDNLNEYWKSNKGSVIDSIESAIPGWTDIPESQRVSLSADYIDQFNTFYKLSGDVEEAKKLTAAYVSRNLGESSINGGNEIMEGAPEMYFSGKGLEKFKSDYQTSLGTIAGDLGGTFNTETSEITIDGKIFKPKLISIPGYTVNQTGEKSYMVIDANTGQLLSLGSFTFRNNYDKIQEDLDKKLEEKKLEIKRTSTKEMVNLSGLDEKSKKALLSLPSNQ